MTNEMKLLLALCDALNLKIEKTTDYQETEISEKEGHRLVTSSILTLTHGTGLKTHNNEFVRGKNNSYFKVLTNPIIDYKLTKKELEPHPFQPGHYVPVPEEHPCLHEGWPPGTVLGVACNCPKCSPTC